MVNGINPQTGTQLQTQPAVQAGETQQGSMRPTYEYIARNNALNAGGSVVMGTAWGLADAKSKLNEEIGDTAKFSDLFKNKKTLGTLKNIGGKILILAGSIALADIVFQKFFKTNKEYEDMYQEDLKAQKK